MKEPKLSKYPLLNVAELRRRAQAAGKRLSREYLLLLNAMVDAKHDTALEVHNGGKKTLDPTVAAFAGIVPRRQTL